MQTHSALKEAANDVLWDGSSGDGTLPINSNEPRPASILQQRQWVLAQIGNANGVGTFVARVRITGPLDVQRLGAAVSRVLLAHPILRAHFKMHQGELAWIPGAAPETKQFDLTGRTPAEQASHLTTWTDQALRSPADLSAGPLVEIAVFQLSSTEHILAIRAHESVCDRTSAEILVGRIAEEYAAAGTGLRVPDAEHIAVGDQFNHFIERQRNFLDGPASGGHLDFWRELRGDLPVLELPQAAPQTADVAAQVLIEDGDRSIQSAVRTLLDSSTVAGISALAALHQCKLESVVLAAFLVVLHRLSGQEDLLVGLPHDGRSTPGTEALVGSLDDDVVLRTQMGDDPVFADLVDRVRDFTAQAMSHRQVPLARVIDELFHGQKRKPGQAPVFQASFATRAVVLGPAFGAATSQPIEIVGACEQDLAMELITDERSRKYELRLQSRPGGISAAALQQMLQRFGIVLNGALAEPAAHISRLPLLSESERKLILEDWNSTYADYPANLLVHQLFEEQVRQRPDAIAVSGKDFSLTYATLNANADQLAARLRTLGAGPQVRVGVLLDRTADMLAAVLAVLKTGGAYVPLDPAYPADRIEYMLADSEAPVLVTQSWLLNRATGFSGQTICVDKPTSPAAPDAINVSPPSDVATPDHPAYVIYTSGSTGKPKGVEVLHRGVVNFLNSMAKAPGFGADDVMLAITTLCFDIAGLELFLPLSFGGRIVLVDRATAADGLALSQFLGGSDVTVAQATPATWRMLIEAGWKGGGNLRRVLTGGEALAPDLAARLLERAAEVWNVYGPTETTIWSTVIRVESAPTGNAAMSIGRPIDNTSCYILDRHAQPVPVGVAGELYIGGHGVAGGYLKRPELTAEKFLPDPFSREPGARMYRTGDMVRYRPDGTIDYLGRGDHQVKIRGHRIELGEIEAEFLRLPDVQSAVVVAREDPPHAKRLVAYVVLRASQTSSEEGQPAGEDKSSPAMIQQFRTVLRARLPEYMVPAAIVVLGALPMTPNGKIDRKALPAPESDSQGIPDFVAPVGPLEVAIAEMFAKAIGGGRVGATDSFFDLGGDSLRAVSLAVMMQESFKATIALADLFQAPTVRQMAAFVRGDQARQTLPGAPIAPVTLRQGDPNLPPLFYFPGAGGYSFEFRAVANQLPPGRTVYGFNLPGAGEPGYRPRFDIKEMAADMLKAVRILCPNGPYLLCGYSFGGFVSVEVARLLREQGDAPALLLILDTWAPGFPQKLTGFRNLAYHTRNMIRGGGLEYVSARVQNIRKRVVQKIRWTARRHRGTVIARPVPQAQVADGAAKGIEDKIEEAYDAAVQAEKEYNPEPYLGGITLFRATVTPQWEACSFDDPTNGWSAYIRGPIEITRFDCHHLNMFISRCTPQVAQHLQECMEKALSGNRIWFPHKSAQN